MGIHWQELVIILLIVLVLFGPKKLPEIGSSLGKSVRGFRESMNGLHEKPTAASITAANADKTSKASGDVAASATAQTPAAEPVPVEVVEVETNDDSKR